MLLLIRFPDPLRDDLTKARTGVVQRDGEWNREQAGRVAGHPVCHTRRNWECSARRQTETSVPLHICVWGKETCSKPADTTNDRGNRDVPAACVESIRAVRQCNGTAETDYPRGHRKQLSFDRTIAEASNDGRSEEGERALRNNIGDLGGLLLAHLHPPSDENLHRQRNAPAFAD